MPFCYQCGTHLPPRQKTCPLCHVKLPPIETVLDSSAQDRFSQVIQEGGHALAGAAGNGDDSCGGDVSGSGDGDTSGGGGGGGGGYPKTQLAVELPSRRKIWLLWRLVTVLGVVSLLVMPGVDTLFGNGVRWSLHANVWVFATWWGFSTVLWFRSKVWLMVLTQAPVLAGTLVAIDAFDAPLNWSLPLGVPMVGQTVVCILIVWAMAVWAKWHWPRLIWMALVLVGPYCIGLELLVDGFLGQIDLRWSIVVTACVWPVATLLGYLGWYLRRHQIDLWRYLHT